jgi:hypothetical protein
MLALPIAKEKVLNYFLYLENNLSSVAMGGCTMLSFLITSGAPDVPKGSVGSAWHSIVKL